MNICDIEELEMDLTGTCNLKCYICTRNFVHSKHMVKKNIRPISEIIKQLDKFKNLKRFFIAGTLSEPTLHPEFLDFIKYLNDRCIKYELFSNGNTHDKEWWEELGKLMRSDSRAVFTVCGSTQELHERYRVGSDLQQILDNASSFRKNNKKIDWVQHILFEYNTDDFKAGNMEYIFKQFSNVIQVHSEGRRLDDRKIIASPDGVIPPKIINTKINYIFSQQPKLKSKIKIECKMCTQKKMYIDQFGNLYPCYTYAENGYPPFLDENNMDLNDILSYTYPDCFLCSEKTNKLIKTLKLDFVC